MTTLKSRIGNWLIPRLPINRRAFDIARHELRAMRTATLNLINPSYHLRVAKLRRARDLQVNLGTGGRGLEGWVNVDLTRVSDTTLALDIRRRLPLADESV